VKTLIIQEGAYCKKFTPARKKGPGGGGGGGGGGRRPQITTVDIVLDFKRDIKRIKRSSGRTENQPPELTESEKRGKANLAKDVQLYRPKSLGGGGRKVLGGKKKQGATPFGPEGKRMEEELKFGYSCSETWAAHHHRGCDLGRST